MEPKEFNQLFKINTDGSWEPIILLKFEDVVMQPGTRYSKGSTVAGVDFSLFLNRSFATATLVENGNSIVVINGIYKQ